MSSFHLSFSFDEIEIIGSQQDSAFDIYFFPPSSFFEEKIRWGERYVCAHRQVIWLERGVARESRPAALSCAPTHTQTPVGYGATSLRIAPLATCQCENQPAIFPIPSHMISLNRRHRLRHFNWSFSQLSKYLAIVLMRADELDDDRW